MSKRRSERGAALVEFAVVFPVLVVMLLAILEFGYGFYTQAAVAGAARTAVRSYAISYSVPNAMDTAEALARASMPDPSQVGVTFSHACTAGQQTTLTLTYRYHSLTGLLDGVLGPELTLTGVGSMQCGG